MTSSYPIVEDMPSPHLTAEQAVEIGERYLDGSLLKESAESARWFFQFAADRDHPEGQDKLASMMKYGVGGPVDHTGARKWYGRAADGRYRPAQYKLAFMMEHGQGGPVDEEGALKWYSRAVFGGHLLGRISLERLFSKRLTASRDEPQPPHPNDLRAAVGRPIPSATKPALRN